MLLSHFRFIAGSELQRAQLCLQHLVPRGAADEASDANSSFISVKESRRGASSPAPAPVASQHDVFESPQQAGSGVIPTGLTPDQSSRDHFTENMGQASSDADGSFGVDASLPDDSDVAPPIRTYERDNFDDLDTDHDSRVDLNDFMAHGGNAAMFDTLDQDHDGLITRSEFNSQVSQG